MVTVTVVKVKLESVRNICMRLETVTKMGTRTVKMKFKLGTFKFPPLPLSLPNLE